MDNNDDLAASSSRLPGISAKRKVIIDTDVGLDDAQAILLVLMDPSVELLGIMCVAGNGSLENVCRNTLRVLTVSGRLDIPVFRGCATPLIGNEKFEEKLNYHGHDGLGDCDEARLGLTVDMSLLQAEHATTALIRLVHQFPGEVSLLCLAPLTNLAISVKIDPEFSKLLKTVYIMGGNHTGSGNETAAAEFNFHHDPEAASIVLNNAGCEVVQVGWEVCIIPTSTFEAAWILDYYAHTTPQGIFLKNINHKSIPLLLEDKYDDGSDAGVMLCDEWVAAIFLDPRICLESQIWPTSVELSGLLTRGQCVVDKRSRAYDKAKGKPNVRHVLSLDVQLMKELLLAMIKSPAFPPGHS